MTTSKRSETKSTVSQKVTDESNVIKFNLKPVIILMAFGGCYTPKIPGRCFLTVMIWIYKGILSSIILLYLLRSIALLSEPMLFISAIMNTLISSQALGNMFICWKIFSARYGNFMKAIEKLKKIISEMTANALTMDIKYFTKRRNIIFYFALITLIIGALAQVVVCFVLLPLPGEYRAEFGNFSDLVSSSFSKPFANTIVTRIGLYLTVVFLLLPYTLPVFFLMSISAVFLTVFNGLNKRIEESTSLDMDSVFTNFETVREIHANLCATIQQFDTDMRHLYGNIFFWTILTGIMVLYTIIKYSMPFMVQLTMAYYLALALVMILSMSILAAMVHEAAHSSLESIYTINVKEEISLGKITQLNLFLSKLSGPQVGFTAFGLLTITKEFILTIAGAFLTYFTVLYTL